MSTPSSRAIPERTGADKDERHRGTPLGRPRSARRGESRPKPQLKFRDSERTFIGDSVALSVILRLACFHIRWWITQRGVMSRFGKFKTFVAATVGVVVLTTMAGVAPATAADGPVLPVADFEAGSVPATLQQSGGPTITVIDLDGGNLFKLLSVNGRRCAPHTTSIWNCNGINDGW